MKVLMKPIEVISTFSTTGEITPIRFRLTAEDGELQVFPIKRIVIKEKIREAGDWSWRFTCEVEVNGIAKLIELRFGLMSCKWMLFKM